MGKRYVAHRCVRGSVSRVRWRLIGPEVLGPELALALDEVMLGSVSSGASPLIRFWTWERKAVTLGSFQMASDEIYLDRCRDDGVPVIRRITGGGCMFHAPGKELIYSVTLPSSEVPSSIPASYTALQTPVLQAVQDLGVKASIIENSIMIGPRKVSGSSQRRVKGAVLHHGTLLIDVDEEEMFRYIKGDKVVPSGKGTCSTYRPVTSLREHIDIDVGKLSKAVVERFMEGRAWERSEWTEAELDRARELASKKYSSDEWNIKV